MNGTKPTPYLACFFGSLNILFAIKLKLTSHLFIFGLLKYIYPLFELITLTENVSYTQHSDLRQSFLTLENIISKMFI